MQGTDKVSASRIVPLVLLALVVALESGSRTLQLLRESASLDAIIAQQSEAFRNADFQRSDFEKLVQATINLAREGNTHVVPVIDHLKRLGVVTSTP